MTEKSLGNIRKTKFLRRALSPVKVGQAWQNANWVCIESKAIYIQNFDWISQKTAEKSPENRNWANGNNSGKKRSNVTKLKLDLFYVITNCKSIYETTAEKSPENLILAKGNNSWSSRSSVTKLELDLYYVMTNSYTKLQVNISKDGIENSGKLKYSKGQ